MNSYKGLSVAIRSVFGLVFLLLVAPAHSVNHEAKVALLQAPTASATYDCVYFTLSGVTQADPVAPGQAWFALPKTHNGYKEIFTILHAAKLSDRILYVGTTGGVGCGGYALVSHAYY